MSRPVSIAIGVVFVPVPCCFNDNREVGVEGFPPEFILCFVRGSNEGRWIPRATRGYLLWDFDPCNLFSGIDDFFNRETKAVPQIVGVAFLATAEAL